MSFTRAVSTTAGLVVGGLLAVRALAVLGWGLRSGEATQILPGDGIINLAAQQLTHAVDVAAPREEVWSWIVQAGYDRAGWYTPRWVDTYLWRVDNPSIDYVDPNLQHLEVGEVILDGPPGTAVFTVMDIKEGRTLVLHSLRHPITGIPPNLAAVRPGPYLDFSWVFHIEESGPDQTRLLLRTRGIAHTGKSARLVGWLLWPTIDYLMARWMLIGIRSRAEAAAALETSHR
ncbi:hypothetical protein ACFLRH_01005 [Actinomycetota bacterium]